MIKRRGLVRLTAAAAVLISIFLICTVQSSAQTYDNEIKLSNSSYFIKTISVTKETIKLTGITSDYNYSYLMLRLIDSNGKDAVKTVKARTSSGECFFSLKGIQKGTYKLCIYHGSQEYGSFSGDFFGNDLSLVRSGKGDYIDIPQALPWNDGYDSSSDKTASLSPEKNIESDSSAIINLASSITAGCTSDYAKAKAIHDWVCRNIYYDYDAYYRKTDDRKVSAVDVLSARHACCDGYSNLTAALLKAAGIPTKTVMGYTFTDGFVSTDIRNNHEWVESFIDGRWVTIDTTWDSDNRWENGAKSVTAEITERYFDPSLPLMSINHAYNLKKPVRTIDLYVGNPRMWNGTQWVNIDDSGTTALIMNGRTLVPIRKIVESLGGTIAWEGSTRTVTCKKGSVTVSMVIDKTEAICNGKAYKMDVSPAIINGRTMIPVRFLVEALNCQVQWYSAGDCWGGKIEII